MAAFPKLVLVKRYFENGCQGFHLSRCVPENAAWNDFLTKPANDSVQKPKTLPNEPLEHGTLEAQLLFSCTRKIFRVFQSLCNLIVFSVPVGCIIAFCDTLLSHTPCYINES
jgi:hypothetical protein